MRVRAGLALLLLTLMLLSACQPAPRTGLDFPDEFPDKLSEWHIVERKGDRLVLNTGVVPYDLNSALFSDYAHKLRTILVPSGTVARLDGENLDLPVGSVISKTFYYPRAQSQASDKRIVVGKAQQLLQGESLNLHEVLLIETRLLINTAKGWVAIPYVWDAEQSDAKLELAGEAFAAELITDPGRVLFTYIVPDTNQCAGCHAVNHHQQIIEPIGLKVRHLNKEFRYMSGDADVSVENQLLHWKRVGLLAGEVDPNNVARNAQWDVEASGSVDMRARAYLDVNCAHCHSSTAAANTSGLLLHAQETDLSKLGVCKIPIAAGRGSGGALFDIVPGAPEQSILVHRMESTEPDVAMPELGRSLVHKEGVALIREWIASLSGSCAARSEVPPPRSSPGDRGRR